MTDMIDAAQNRDGTGVLEKPRNASVRHGQSANDLRWCAKCSGQRRWFHGNKAAQAGARAWLDTIEKLRQPVHRFTFGKAGLAYHRRAHDRGRAGRWNVTWHKGAAAAGPRTVMSTPMGPMDNAAMLDMLVAHTPPRRTATNKTGARAVHRLRKARQPYSDHRVIRTSATARRGWTIMSDFWQGQFVRRHDRPHQRHDPRHCAGGAHRAQTNSGSACRTTAAMRADKPGAAPPEGDRRQPVICQHAPERLLEPGERQRPDARKNA